MKGTTDQRPPATQHVSRPSVAPMDAFEASRTRKERRCWLIGGSSPANARPSFAARQSSKVGSFICSLAHRFAQGKPRLTCCKAKSSVPLHFELD